MKLSVVIIAYNEAQNLPRCLASVQGLADDIIVVDSFSSDDSFAIAEAAGARAVRQQFDGYEAQKNAGLALAPGPWVLSLDADECLSEALAASIRAVLAAPDAADAYTMNRRNFYAGRWIRHAGWYPDRQLRLWRKGMGQWSGGRLHEYVRMQPGSRTAHLDGDLLHYTVADAAHHRQKVRHFSDVKAPDLKRRPAAYLLYKLLLNPFVRFLRAYVVKQGWREGRRGWQIASISAYGEWLKYSKALRLKWRDLR